MFLSACILRIWVLAKSAVFWHIFWRLTHLCFPAENVSTCLSLFPCRFWNSGILADNVDSGNRSESQKCFIRRGLRSETENLLICIICSGCINTFVTVYMEDGVRKGLYRGLSINYLRVVPQVSVMFSVYELTKQFLSQEVTSPRSEWVVYAPYDSVKDDSVKDNSMKAVTQAIQ